jgi:hypothetical protein
MNSEDVFGGRTLVRAGLQSRWASEAEASRGLKPALQASSSSSVTPRDEREAVA